MIAVSVVVQPNRPPRPRTPQQTAPLRVSAYDRVASLVVALLVMVGLTVLAMLVTWLSMTMFHFAPKAVPAKLEELIGGGYENGEGTAGMQIDSPSESDIAGESDLADQPPAIGALTAIADSSLMPAADLDRLDDLERKTNVVGKGRSTGTGNRPAKGRGGGFGGGEARPQRWELRFPEGGTVDSYARQLDFFGIEPALFGVSNDVIYLSRLTQPVPTQRVGPRTAEGRMYMSWTRGDLNKADQDLFRRAGIEVNDRMILKFLPPETEARLAKLEREFKNHPVKEIRRTRFGIKPEGRGFAFFVIEQTYF